MASKVKYMVIVGFKGTEYSPLSFYSLGKPIKNMDGDVLFTDPMQKSDVSITSGMFSFFSTKKITEAEFEEHKAKVEEQEKMANMYNEDPFGPTEGTGVA